MPFGLLKSITGRLEKVDIALATMGGVVEQQVADCISAFERGDLVLAADVRLRDRQVDDQQCRIEQQVLVILEDRHPTGLSLRRAIMAIRIAGEMERIGDLAKNIAKRTGIIAAQATRDDIPNVIPVVARIGRRALSQFGESLDSLSVGNADAARALREADDQIDDLYNSIFEEILVAMGQSSAGVVFGTHLVFIAKNYERIGDHATNIAGHVHFTLTGHSLGDEHRNIDPKIATALQV